MFVRSLDDLPAATSTLPQVDEADPQCLAAHPSDLDADLQDSAADPRSLADHSGDLTADPPNAAADPPYLARAPCISAFLSHDSGGTLPSNSLRALGAAPVSIRERVVLLCETAAQQLPSLWPPTSSGFRVDQSLSSAMAMAMYGVM